MDIRYFNILCKIIIAIFKGNGVITTIIIKITLKNLKEKVHIQKELKKMKIKLKTVIMIFHYQLKNQINKTKK